MDFNDTPEEAAHRKQVRAWLDKNATRKADAKGMELPRDLDALIRLGQRTGGIGWLLLWFKVFPKPARNWMYARVARNRYAMFGRADMCDIPNDALKMRLLL